MKTIPLRRRAALAAAALLAVLSVAVLTGCQVVDQAIEDLGDKTSSGQSAAPTAPAEGESTPANLPMSVETQVIRVIDGDTVAVVPVEDVLKATDDEGTEHVVRVLGIDAPEMNYTSGDPECGAQAATDHLETLLPEHMPVTIQYDQRSDRTDKYGRSLAYVTTRGGTDVGLAQVTDGFAMPWYPSGEPEPERVPAYEAAAEQATDAGVGSHGQCETIGRQ